MATIKEEIMSIAEAQGYEGEGGSTIAEAVNALGSVMGDYELPAATATTLGGIKVGDGLSVTSDGTLSASGGGDAPMVVNFKEGNGGLVADKSYNEIEQAVKSGKVVFATETINGPSSTMIWANYYQLVRYYNSPEPGATPDLKFTSAIYDKDGYVNFHWIIYPKTGAITTGTKTINFDE